MFNPEQVSARAAEIAFGKPLSQNNLRGLVVEVNVEAALGSAWTLCSADWLSWDFQHSDGTRLEIKQSAAQQTWPDARKPSPPIFDIRSRKGYWEGASWLPGVGRKAHIYIFAYHPLRKPQADHRDPRQWEFYVIPTLLLPANERIGLGAVKAMSTAIHWERLSLVVEDIRVSIKEKAAL